VKTALTSTAVVLIILTCGCGRKEAPADESPDSAKGVKPDMSGEVDPNMKKDVESLPGLDEVAGDEERREPEGSIAGGYSGRFYKTLTLELTAGQREDLTRQREENRASGRRDVTLKFTPGQLEAIREVCPECRDKAITWHTDRVGVRVKLYFDDAGQIVKPPDPFPYVSR